jgi:threonine dehydrogenase-like Zn-dependent dehydrogenase
MGHAPAGLFGFSHLLGGYAGGKPEYLRVPHADAKFYGKPPEADCPLVAAHAISRRNQGLNWLGK